MEHLDPKQIKVSRETRQRREIKLSPEFLASIKRGIINPLVIDHEDNLIAGERRLTAALELGLPGVPVRRFRELSERERALIELEENIQRADLPWQDQVRTFERMFELYSSLHPTATVAAFAESIGYSQGMVSNFLEAAKALRKELPSVVSAPSITKAINVIARQKERQEQNALAEIFDTVAETGSEAPPDQPAPRQPDDDLLCANFHEFATTYSGPKFNLLHCDFPYGIDLDQSAQVQAEHDNRLKTYKDDEDTYWQLLHSLANNFNRFVSSSAHIIFWFSFKHYDDTRRFFNQYMPQVHLDPFPLIWLKSDNRGIIPDAERGPRRIYETALFGRVGDRKIIKPVSNGYPAPKSNSHHMSEKPEPVLRHFFSMVVDGNTRMLDPTCGSGTSLRAAESLGAERVLGLELDPAFHEQAVKDLRTFRTLRAVAA